MQPPPSPRSLTASCHLTSVLSSAASEQQIVQPLRRLVQPVCTNPSASSFAPNGCRTLAPISLVQSGRDAKASPEKFRHNSTAPILLWFPVRQSLGKRRQRAHPRRFPRPPRF